MPTINVSKTYLDFNAAGSSNSVTSSVSGISITGSFIEIVTAFTNSDPNMASLQALTLNAYTDATTTAIPNDGNNPADTLRAFPKVVNTDIPITLNCENADLSTLTAGEMIVHYYYEDNN